MDSSRNINKKKTVLVIGIDGATFNIINPMVNRGQLPNIKKLMSSGVYGTLTSTVPAVSPVAWTSFMTGTNPAKHGIYDFSGRVPNSYRFKINNATDRKTKPLWVILSELGKRVCVAGVTMTYPPDAVNGYMISGLGTPHELNATFTHPPELNKEFIEKEFGKFIVVPRFNLKSLSTSAKGKRAYIENVYEAVEQRTGIFNALWSREHFDFGMVFFLDTDGVSHYFWKYMDTAHKGHDPESAKEFGDAIFNTYKKVDESIGQIIKGIKDDCHVIIVSDHGFGPIDRVLLLNNWLNSKGYLKFKSGINRLQSTLSKFRGRKDTLPNIIEMIDWKRTKAFFNGTVGNIFINLKGREPQGTVTPGEEYARLCDTLIKDLYELTDPETGHKVVKKVYRKDEVFQGGQFEIAPDLTVIPGPRYGIAGQDIVLHGLRDRGEIIVDSNNWSGNHEPEGIFIASGPSFKSGREISGARIADIVPTILYLMGSPIPSTVDGKVLNEAFKDDFVSSHEVLFSSEGTASEARHMEYTESEAELVTKRLQDLGYFE